MSHLLDEIQEQPAVLARLLERQGEHVRAVARAVQRLAPPFVMVAARGTSDHAATYGQYLLANACGLPVALAAPSLFTMYRHPPRLRGTLVVGISQSGSSPDIVEVVAEGRRQGALTLAITNNLTSPLAQAAEFCVPCEAGAEHSIAATKTYTAQLTILAMLAVAIADERALWQGLARLPDIVAQALQVMPDVQEHVERYRYMETCVLIGRGYNYATAVEIALKLKELTYIAAEPYSSADFRHGPIAIVEHGFPVLVIAPSGAVYDDVQAMLHELRQREAETLVISDQPEALDLAQTPLRLPPGTPEWLSPIAAVIPGQLLAAELARIKGYDPDHPRGLHKVTRTT